MKTLFAIALAAAVARAAIFSPVFSDGAVLQIPSPRFFGHTENGFSDVYLRIDDVIVSRTTSDARGFWSITIPNTKADAIDATIGHKITATANGEEHTLFDVLFGNVFICAGQNDMSKKMTLTNAAMTAIRGMTVSNKMQWEKLDASSAFSSVCYGVGERAAADMETPIGLIDTSIADSLLSDWVHPAAVLDKECLAVSGPNRGYIFDKLDDMGVTGIPAAGVAWLHDGEVAEEHTCLAAAATQAMQEKFLSADINSLRASAVRVIAHRGLASACPENTIVCQEVARKGGTEWIENDVHLTKDGIPVVMHDASVQRTTNGTGNIPDMTLEQIQALDAGSWFAPAFAGHKVPTLLEQLKDLHSRGGNLLLEVKDTQSVENMKRIHDDIASAKMTKRVIIQSFGLQNLINAYSVDSSIPIHYLSTNWTNPVELIKMYHLSGFNPDSSAFNNLDKVKAIQATSATVYVWTLDTPELWKKAIDNNIDGIITNKATTLQGYLSFEGASTVSAKPARAVAFAHSNSENDEAIQDALESVGVAFVASQTLLTSNNDAAAGLWKALHNAM